MKNKSLILKLLMLILMLVTAFSFIACDDSESSSDGEKVNVNGETAKEIMTLDKASARLDRYETVLLLCSETEGVTWQSENEAIATVVNGNVEAKGVGETKVKAVKGDEEAICSITVYDSGAVPVVLVENPEIVLAKGNDINIGATVQYKGNNCEDAVLSYSVIEGSDVISVDKDGQITTKNISGSAKIKVEGVWRSVSSLSLLQTINVEVKSIYSLYVESDNITLNNVASLHGQDFKLSDTIISSVVIDGVKENNANVVWTVEEGSDVVSVTDDVVTANKIGSAILTGTYNINQNEQITVTVNVNVVLPILDSNERMTFIKDAEQYATSVGTYNVFADEVFLDSGKTITKIVDANDGSVLSENASVAFTDICDDVSNKEWIVYNDEYGVKIPVEVSLIDKNASIAENTTYILSGKTKTGQYASPIANIDNSYIAWEGSYGAGKYLEFEFTGNNMPQMMFFADTIDGKLYGYEYEGIDKNATITNATARQGLLFLNGLSTSPSGNNTGAKFRIWGMNRFNPPTLNGGYTELSGYLKEIKNNTANDVFTQAQLSTTYENVTFKYVVGTYKNIEGKLCIDAKLYNKATGELLGNIGFATEFDADEYTGNIVAYGTVKSGEHTMFKVVKGPYDYEPVYAKLVSSGINASVTTESGEAYTLAGQAKTGAYAGRIAQIDNSYIAWKGNYGAGTYLEFEFTGNNMPQMMFFADTIDGKLYGYEYEGGVDSGATITNATARQGLLFLNGLSTSASGNNTGGIFRLWGMNRFTPHSLGDGYLGMAGELYEITSGAENGVFTQYQLATTYADVTFRYVVGTYKNEEGKLCVDAKLYNKATNELVGSIDYATTYNADDYTGSIVAYATVKGVGNDTTFTVVKEPYTVA